MDEEVLIPLTMFAMVGLIAWKYYDTRHKERMHIIDSGLVNKELKYLFGKAQNSGKFTALKYGLLFLFAGLGFLLSSAFTVSMHEDIKALFIVPSVFIGGGLGLVLHYLIASKAERQDAEIERLREVRDREMDVREEPLRGIE